MRTFLSATAVTLALALPAFAQDARPTTPPAAAPATPVQTPPAQAAPTPATPKAEAKSLPPKADVKAAQPAAAVTPKAATPVVPPKVDAKAVAPAAAKAAVPAAAKAATPAKIVNINTATPAELDALPQIGKARTKAIIAGRPYKSVDDLLTKKVLPKNAYEAIKARVSVN